MPGIEFINRISRRFRFAGESEALASPERVQSPGTSRHSLAIPRLAYCKTDAGAGSIITCYLDKNLTGREISVKCSICGGSNLNSAIPKLETGVPIIVSNIDGEWRCHSNFQGYEECDCYQAS